MKAPRTEEDLGARRHREREIGFRVVGIVEDIVVDADVAERQRWIDADGTQTDRRAVGWIDARGWLRRRRRPTERGQYDERSGARWSRAHRVRSVLVSAREIPS